MLGAAWVEYVHDELIHKFWTDAGAIGSRGVKNRSLLESAVARPFQTVFGQEAYPGILEKSSALFHSLIANHPFHDGNKRTAVISVHHFLAANGFFLVLSNEETYDLAKKTASYRQHGVTHKQIFEEISSSLAPRMVSIQNLRSACKRSDSGSAYLLGILTEVSHLRRKVRSSHLNRLVPTNV